MEAWGQCQSPRGQKLYEYVELVVLRGGGGAVLMWMWICVCLADCDNVVGVLESSSWKWRCLYGWHRHWTTQQSNCYMITFVTIPVPVCAGNRTARPQSISLKQVVSGHWKPSRNSGRQGHTWTLPASPATSADVLVRRGSGYMHIVALTYQPEFTVIRDLSRRWLRPPPPVCASCIIIIVVCNK